MPPLTPWTLDQAVAAHREGRIDDAVRAYEALLEADPRLASVRHNLGMVSLGQGRLDRALPLLEHAYVEDGGNAGWLHSLAVIGMTLYEHNCWEDAYVWLERAVARAPADAAVAAALARVRARDYLAPEVYDPVQARTLLRHAPRESANYVYAIDIVGTCNLRCPTCPVGNSQASERPRGFMPLDLFEKIILKIVAERVDRQAEIWLFNWGEPLLHPDLPALIGIVKAHGLRCHLSSNLNVEHGLAEMVKAAPDDLKISLSGFTPETYERTHARGKLMLMKANLYLLRHYLDKYGVATKVWVGHHLYKGGESQLAAVAAVCQELGFAHHPIAAFYQPLERLVELIEGRGKPGPIIDSLIESPLVYVPRNAARSRPGLDCELRFNQTVINHDGSVALCCSVYDKENMLGLQFVDTPHAQIERARYEHAFCATCMHHGLSYSIPDARRIGA
ncbi:radical SAM protein [Oxalobacteraceae bacterium]|nr:radical SAM protein [Oxalobacteraceae bacterium]